MNGKALESELLEELASLERIAVARAVLYESPQFLLGMMLRRPDEKDA